MRHVQDSMVWEGQKSVDLKLANLQIENYSYVMFY
jgi:hypothetical protein